RSTATSARSTSPGTTASQRSRRRSSRARWPARRRRAVSRSRRRPQGLQAGAPARPLADRAKLCYPAGGLTGVEPEILDARRQLVGREPELGVARRFVEHLSGGACGLLLEGEPGIGKTAVWAAALELAEAAG